jgi:hypothetical protein
MLVFLSVLAAVVMGALLFRLFFEDFADFIECLRFYFQPDIISVFRGEWAEDWWATMKLGVWLVLSLGMGFVTLVKLPDLFPQLLPDQAARQRQVQTVAARTATAELSEPAVQNQVAAASKVTNVGTNTTASAQTATTGGYASRYRVKVGDTVEIAALNPAIALRRATVMAIDDEQITVKSSFDEYKVPWKELTKLKTAGK